MTYAEFREIEAECKQIRRRAATLPFEMSVGEFERAAQMMDTAVAILLATPENERGIR
jgi:hypothetical protein